jgi:hypothetical protein
MGQGPRAMGRRVVGSPALDENIKRGGSTRACTTQHTHHPDRLGHTHGPAPPRTRAQMHAPRGGPWAGTRPRTSALSLFGAGRHGWGVVGGGLEWTGQRTKKSQTRNLPSPTHFRGREKGSKEHTPCDLGHNYITGSGAGRRDGQREGPPCFRMCPALPLSGRSPATPHGCGCVAATAPTVPAP